MVVFSSTPNLKKENISGNLRGALKHWKDPHLGKGKYLLYEASQEVKESCTEANNNPTSGQLSQNQEFPESNGLFHQQVTITPRHV